MCDHHGHCEHSIEAEDFSISFSLFKYIDLPNLQCLNECSPGSGKYVFKPYEDRKTLSPFVESDVDAELLFNIPFTGSVKLKGVIVAGEDGESHPSLMRLYKNRPFMTFSDTEGEADQEIELHPDVQGDIMYPCKVTKFANVHHLSIHIAKNFGAEQTKIHYIGLRGDFSEAQRQGIVLTNYEVTPNISDHKADIVNNTTYFIK
uniref:PITH domain-containing protein 1 n=1 Tax=Schistocephalus solidus TaxID=70667 RepID=A0A0X3PW28_SCHSO